MKRIFTHLLLLLISIGTALGQEGKWLKYEIVGGVTNENTLIFQDSLTYSQYIKTLYADLHRQGFLLPRAEEKQLSKDSTYIQIHTGEKFLWVDLRQGNIDQVTFVKSGIDLRNFKNKPLNYQTVARIFEKVLEETENSGYPFASIGLDSIQREEEGISAALNLQRGPYITFDTLRITGDSKTDRKFLSKFMQVMPQEPFSQKRINEGIRQVRNLPYLRWAGEPELSFQNEEAILYMPIDDRRINSIDGIIGFLPNELEGGRMLITGQFDLVLYNLAGKGRNYELHWQRFNQFSQSLQVSGFEPLVLGSPIDIQASFSLLKEDTTFLTRDFRLDLGYRLGAGSYLRFFTRRQAGDLLSVTQLGELSSLPEVGDFRFTNYGMGLEQSWLDDFFFPRRGAFAKLEFGIGNKLILANTALPVELYENTDLRTLQYYTSGRLEKHFYFSPGLGLFTRLSGGIMENPNLFVNDLFRLGGLRTVRGFNENFFFANNYIYFNFEPRYYFDTYSYFMIFADVGRIDNQVQKLPVDFPYAAGMGFSLETGNGIFNFVYALGGANAQDFALNLSKIHFGYTGRF